VAGGGDISVVEHTNAIVKHAVLPVKNERIIERSGADVEPRISVVMRDIETRLSRAQMAAKIARSERSKERARQSKGRVKAAK
jgi:hypothetical protein